MTDRPSPRKLLPVWVVQGLRAGARAFRRLKRRVLAIPAVREITNEALFGEFTPEEHSAHETLLADTVRMAAYREGIRRHVKPGEVVVDLGTGTGILAMLAAQQGPKVVHAIDSSDIVFLARRVAAANGFTNIEFHRADSRRLTLDEPVDVVVHEQIGQALVDEGVIEKTLDLKRRLLSKTGRILPGRFELFLEPVTLKPEYRVPYLWQAQFPGISFASLEDAPECQRYRQSGQDWRVDARAAIDAFLTRPEPILTIDLNTIRDPSEVPRRVTATRLMQRTGRMDGFALFFRVVFDETLAFDTSPFSPRTVWENLYCRTESTDRQQGDLMVYTLAMHDRSDFTTWTVRIDEPPSGFRSL